MAAFRAQTTVTRPANTTAYTANDVLGATAAAIQLGFAGRSGAQILISSIGLRIDTTAVPSGMTTFRLYLYDATPPSALADNAAFDLPSGDRANFLGYVDLGTPVDLGSTLYVQTDGVNKHIQLGAESAVYGYLVTAGAFTPAANSEVYTVTLMGVTLE